MKFTIPQKPLLAALSRCASVAGNRSTMPILSHVLLQPAETMLKLTATDLETGYTTVIGDLSWSEPVAEADRRGIALPAKKLHEIVKALPAPDVCFNVNLVNLVATISGGTSSFSLACLDPAEFPELPDMPAASAFDLDAPALVKILSSVKYCQSADETKYHLCSCFLKVEENNEGEQFITAVATDGHRLALDTIELQGEPRVFPVDLLKGIILSRKSVAEICKITTPGVIVIGIQGNNLCIATDNEKIYLRLVDGQYPDYNRVIPQGNGKRIEVKRQALMESLERCRIISSKDSRGVQIQAEAGALTLFSSWIEIGGEACDQVTASVPDEPLLMRLDIDYLHQALEHLESGIVEILVKDELHPIIINRLGTCEPFAVIVPMRN